MTLFFHFLYFILNKLRKCIAERPMMSLPVHNKPFYFSEEGFLIDPMHGLSYSDKIHATIGKRLQPLTLTGHKRQVTSSVCCPCRLYLSLTDVYSSHVPKVVTEWTSTVFSPASHIQCRAHGPYDRLTELDNELVQGGGICGPVFLVKIRVF